MRNQMAVNEQTVATQIQSADDDEIDVFALFSLLLAKWPILLAFVVVGVVAGAFTVNYLRPVFHSDVLLQMDLQGNKAGMAIGDMGALFDEPSPAEAEIELIQSRMVLDSVVARVHLAYGATPVNLYRRLTHEEGRVDLGYLHLPATLAGQKWNLRALSADSYEVAAPGNGSVLKGKIGDTYRLPLAGDTLAIRVLSMYAAPGEVFRLSEVDPSLATDALKSRLSVEEVGKKTGIIRLGLNDRYADRAAAVLDAIADVYVRQNVEMKSKEATKTLLFLERELPSVKAKLDSSEAAYTAYRHKVGSIDLTGETNGILGKRVELESELLMLSQKEQDTDRLFKGDHPAVAVLKEQEAQIQRQLDSIGASVKGLPLIQQQMFRLQGDVDVNNTIYMEMLNNMQQLRVAQGGEIGNVRVVDRARTEINPVKPRKRIVFLAFVAGSFVLGAAFVFFLHVLRTRGVRSASEIEKATGVSVYARIPEVKMNRTAAAAFSLVEIAPDDTACAALRMLRTALEFSFLEEKRGKVLLVTGLSAGIGKSFVSRNLSALFALRQKKVLLIDADLRRGRLSSRGHHKGLSDYFLGQIALDEAIEHIEGANIDLIGTGRAVPSPSEIIASSAFGRLIASARERYDVVIVDTPPVLLMTDAQLACRVCDFALLLVRYGSDSMENINDALDLLDQVNMKSRAIVLNRCVHEPGAYGSYNYRYSYKYK